MNFTNLISIYETIYVRFYSSRNGTKKIVRLTFPLIVSQDTIMSFIYELRDSIELESKELSIIIDTSNFINYYNYNPNQFHYIYNLDTQNWEEC